MLSTAARICLTAAITSFVLVALPSCSDEPEELSCETDTDCERGLFCAAIYDWSVTPECVDGVFVPRPRIGGVCTNQVAQMPQECLDRDCDGYPAGGCDRTEVQDCNDDDPRVHPSASELCNSIERVPIDDDCDGEFDESETGEPLRRRCQTWSGAWTLQTCSNGVYAECVLNPIGELATGRDGTRCDRDEQCAERCFEHSGVGFCGVPCRAQSDCSDGWFCDLDRTPGHGFESQFCVPPDFCSDSDGDGFGWGPACEIDCDDTDATTNAEADELCNDEQDNDCDRRFDEGC